MKILYWYQRGSSHAAIECDKLCTGCTGTREPHRMLALNVTDSALCVAGSSYLCCICMPFQDTHSCVHTRVASHFAYGKSCACTMITGSAGVNFVAQCVSLPRRLPCLSHSLTKPTGTNGLKFQFFFFQSR